MRTLAANHKYVLTVSVESADIDYWPPRADGQNRQSRRTVVDYEERYHEIGRRRCLQQCFEELRCGGDHQEEIDIQYSPETDNCECAEENIIL